jgi:hypothetical protein
MLTAMIITSVLKILVIRTKDVNILVSLVMMAIIVPLTIVKPILDVPTLLSLATLVPNV